MAIYFLCTSVYSAFVTYFLTKTTYQYTSAKKILFMLEHVNNLVAMRENLEKIGLWDEIHIIKTIDKSMEDISSQFDKFSFKKEDVFHFYGTCMESFLLYSKFPQEGKIIVTYEGVGTLDLKNGITKFYNKSMFQNKEFDFDKISEIWLFDTRLSVNHFGKPEVTIPFESYMQDIAFRNEFLKDMKFIFKLENLSLKRDPILFFDQYFSIRGDISFEAERFILSQFCWATKDFHVFVKQHPGENEKDKYKDLPIEFLPHSEVPWEVLALIGYYNNIANEEDNSNSILITYTSSCVFNHRSLLKGKNVYIIFLNRILERYSATKIEDMNYLNNFIEVYGSDNIFYPESFTELRKIIWNIQKPNILMSNVNQLQFEENDREYTWFKDFYYNNWRNAPNARNISTLSFDCGQGFNNEQKVNIVTEKFSSFSFKFPVPEKCRETLIRVQWYAVRGRNARIQIHSISYVDLNDDYRQIDLSSVIHYGKCNCDNYIQFESFDPCFFIPFPYKAKQIEIKGDWEFDNSYQSILNTANLMATSLANRLESSILEKNKIEQIASEEAKRITELEKKNEELVLEIKKQKEYFKHQEAYINDLYNKQEGYCNLLKEKNINLTRQVLAQESRMSSLYEEMDSMKARSERRKKSFLWKLIERL